MALHYLFVYGSLKPQYCELPSEDSLHDWVAAEMYDLGFDAALVEPKDWPSQRPDKAIMPRGVRNHVKGHTLLVTNAVLESADKRLGSEYRRIQVRALSGFKVWVHCFEGEIPARARQCFVWTKR